MHRGSQALLPRAEGPVGFEPPTQPVPAADQCLMHQFRRFLAVGVVAIGDHQASIGQARHKFPVVVTYFSPAGKTPGVLSGLARLYKLDKYLLSAALLFFAQLREYLFGVDGQGFFDPAYLIIS